MKFSTFISLTLVVITSLSLFACGSGGGGFVGGATPTPALTADKMTAVTPVVLNGGTTTITFDFGAANAGKTVTFTASPSATLTPPSTVLDSLGKASVIVSAAPSDVTVNVTASIHGYTGTKAVPFIKQPDKVVVHVALTKTITDLEWLAFGLQNDLAWTYASYTPAPGYISYNDITKSTLLDGGSNFYSWAILVPGLNVAPSTNLLEMTFTPAASAGIPFFEIFTPLGNPGNLSYFTYSLPTINLATTDFVIKTDYYLGAALLATN